MNEIWQWLWLLWCICLRLILFWFGIFDFWASIFFFSFFLFGDWNSPVYIPEVEWTDLWYNLRFFFSNFYQVGISSHVQNFLTPWNRRFPHFFFRVCSLSPWSEYRDSNSRQIDVTQFSIKCSSPGQHCHRTRWAHLSRMPDEWLIPVVSSVCDQSSIFFEKMEFSSVCNPCYWLPTFKPKLIMSCDKSSVQFAFCSSLVAFFALINSSTGIQVFVYAQTSFFFPHPTNLN